MVEVLGSPTSSANRLERNVTETIFGVGTSRVMATLTLSADVGWLGVAAKAAMRGWGGVPRVEFSAPPVPPRTPRLSELRQL